MFWFDGGGREAAGILHLRGEHSGTSAPQAAADRRGRQDEAPGILVVRRCYTCNSEKHLQCSCPSHRGSPLSDKKPAQHRRGFKGSQVSVVKLAHKPDYEGWLIDSGASQHVVCNRDLLATVKPAASASVYVANGLSAPILGEGDVVLEGFAEPLQNVLYVPQLKHNLLNASGLTTQGYTVTFEGDDCMIRRNDWICVQGKRLKR